MYFEIEKKAKIAIKNALEKLNYENPEEIPIEFPPNPKMGDLASTISFQIAKQLKTSPMEITNNIVENIEIPPNFKKIESKGPYINFFINYELF